MVASWFDGSWPLLRPGNGGICPLVTGKAGGSGFDDGLVLEGEGGACIYVNVDSLRGNISYPHLRASRSTVRN